MIRSLALLSIGVTLTAVPAAALDASLYPEAAPDDAAFVRFIDHQTGTPNYDGMTFTLTEGQETAYYPVSASALGSTAAGAYVTVVQTSDGSATTISEDPRSDRSKVYLILLNTSSAPVSLKVVDGHVPVIVDVPQGASALRAVNPVEITLGVYQSGGDTPLQSFDLSMRRGQNLSFIATDKGVRLIENRFGPVAK